MYDHNYEVPCFLLQFCKSKILHQITGEGYTNWWQIILYSRRIEQISAVSAALPDPVDIQVQAIMVDNLTDMYLYLIAFVEQYS